MKVELAPGYKPHAKQRALHRSKARFLVAAAGVRGGKSYSATVEFCRRIYQDVAAGKGTPPVGTGKRRQPRLLYWIVSPTTALAKVPVRYLLELIPPALIERVYEAENSIWLRPDVLVEIKTAQNPEMLVAAAVNGMLVDEACRVKPDAWRGALRGRLTDTKGWALFATSPLGGRNNWVYSELVSRAEADPQIEAFNWQTVDNPYIDPAEVEAARLQLPPAWFKRDYEASWDSFGGAIYDEFSDDRHITTEDKLRLEWAVGRDRPLRDFFKRIIGGIDFGFSAAGCILAVGEVSERRWVVLDEVYAPGMRPIGTQANYLDQCNRLASKWDIREWFADPEDAGAIFDLRNNGLSIRPAHKNVYQGIRRVASALHSDGTPSGKPGLQILAHCTNTIREIRNYQWKATRDGGGFLEEPADGQDDHAMDVLRYCAMELRLYDYVTTQRNDRNRGQARPIG